MDIAKIIWNFFDPFYVVASVFFLCIVAILAQIVILIFWKKAKATVSQSYLESKEGRHRHMYRAVIEYKYVCDGNEYSGKSDWIMNEYHSWKSSMQQKIDKNPLGKELEILINPLDPKSSAIRSEVNPFHWILILVLIFTGIFAFVLYTKFGIA